MAHTVSPALDSVESRPLANFPPSIWGDYFLVYASDFKTIVDDASATKQEYNELKEEVRRMLKVAVNNPLEKLNLINEVQRLGVSYHFEIEIEESLEKIYHDTDFDHSEVDLNTAALRFRLLRRQGYRVSCADTFNKFKDEEGNFKESLICDIRGMLSFYEATHLSTHADEILDEALVFTTTHLEKSVASHTSHPSLERQVKHALSQPIHKNIPRIEARQYLSFYGEEDLRDETLLRFAKLDFNILQSQHQKELGYITKWWKDLNIPVNLPYARDRIVELYYWILGVYFEPQYALGRRFLTQVLSLGSIMDDTYDAYGKIDELVLFTQAIERWDISLKEQLPEYMKVLYQAILDVYKEMEVETSKEGRSYAVHYAKESMKTLVRGYFQEAKWFNEKYFPTVEEYMPVGLSTGGMQMLAPNSFVTMGVATKEAFEWAANDPKIVRAANMFARLKDDLASHKFERKRGHLPSGVECYMKQYGLSKEEVIDLFQKQLISAWKDANEAFLKPTAVPAPLLERVLNLARVMDVVYNGEDRYTNPHLIKDSVASLLKDPIPI